MKNSKLLLLVLTFASLLFLTTANEMGSQVQLEQTKPKTYNWILDMILIPIDMFILIGLSGPVYWFASFFGNCPQCYVQYVIDFMNTPFLQLSYKYM